MLIHHLLEQSAQRFPERPAVLYQEKSMTYGQIDAQADQVAHVLRAQGINRGDRVAILYENSFNYVISYYGILKAGAITVALNTDTTAEALVYFLNHSGAKALLTRRRYERFLEPALPETPQLELLITDDEQSPEPHRTKPLRRLSWKGIYDSGKANLPKIRSVDIDPASIVYTSGSAGSPKGVTLSHLNIISNTRSIVEYLDLCPSDRIMAVLPFSYIYGNSLLNTHFFAGGSVVIDNRFAFPQTILETMQKTEVTGFAGVPSTFLILLRKSAVRKLHFPSLRYVTQAGGHMAPSIQKEVADIFAPAKLYIMYGATEASARLSYLDPASLPLKRGSIGKAIPNVELFVVDDDGKKLPPRQIGQIAARGSNIMVGYWNDPARTAQALRNGLYFTGDLGYEDEEGFLFITGRLSDIIKPGGFRVSALEVEEAIINLPGVDEVAVIGVPDPVLGEAVKAFIVLREGDSLDIERIRKDLSRTLPPYKQPKYIEFRKSLPRNNSGKILKEALKDEPSVP